MPQASTQLMARIIGPFLVLFAIGVATRAPTLDLLIRGFLQDGPLVFVTGAFGLAIGCIMVAAHNRWNSPAAVVVSAVGWVTLLRSAMLLIAPTFVAMVATGVTGVPGLPFAIAIVGILIGVWLTIVGWSPSKNPAP